VKTVFEYLSAKMRGIFVILLFVLCAAPLNAQTLDLPLDSIVLPPGFNISLYTPDTVQNPRSLAVAESNGTIIVYASSNSAGVVTAIVNSTGTPRACTLLRGLNNPEGLVYTNGSLFIGQVTNVTRYDGVNAAALANCTGLAAPKLIATPFPSTSDHNARHIELGPDNKLYISFGSPANLDTCGKYQNISKCSIVRMNADGTGLEDYAVGVRNTVGFTWSATGQFFFSMIERDLMGDNRPDDVLFVGGPAGTNYSWPYCHRQGSGDPYKRDSGPGTALADTDLYNVAQKQILASNPADVNGSLNAYCNSSTVTPIQAYGPHVSALGLKFYNGSMFPEEYRGSLFVPQHGSWNRAFKIGYRLTNVMLDSNNQVANYTVFASGWLQNQNNTAQSVWGKPVATAELPDGSLLLSDDTANAIYRITYTAPAAPAPVSTVG
jgi:glucose/arabinose dehydrogenase